MLYARGPGVACKKGQYVAGLWHARGRTSRLCDVPGAERIICVACKGVGTISGVACREQDVLYRRCKG